MKIQLMEWVARTTTADRLCGGSRLLAKRLADRLTAWVHAGRRDDMEGWRAAVGPTIRLAILAAPAYLLYRSLRIRNGLWPWPLAAVWLAAAWRTARRAEQREAELAQLVQLVRDLIGDRNGALLAEVLGVLQQADEQIDFPALREALEEAGIPVRASLKVGGAVSPGIHLDDLLAAWDVEPTPPPATPGNPSPGGVTSPNYPNYPQSEGDVDLEEDGGAPAPPGLDGHFADVLDIIR